MNSDSPSLPVPQVPCEIPSSVILENISDAFVALDASWKFTYVNRNYMRMISSLFPDPLQLVGRNVWDAFPDIVGTEIETRYRQAMETQIHDSWELFYAPIKSWLEVRVFPSPSLLCIYLRDITNRKTQEQDLRDLSRKVSEQAHFFDSILSHINDLAYSFDLDGNFIYANKPLLTLWNKTLEEISGKSPLKLAYTHELAVKLIADVKQVAATGKPVSGETYYADATGHEDYHEYVFSPVFDGGGKIVAVTGTTRLMTERKNAERANRQLAAIVESSEDAIISKNLNSIVTSWNHGAEVLFGYKAEEMIGKSITVLIPSDRLGEEKTILDRINCGERIHHYETMRQKKNGEIINVSLTVSPIRDTQGTIVGVSKIARDITKTKEAERALNEARENLARTNEELETRVQERTASLREAVHQMEEFSYTVSHDLRAPLRAMQAYSNAVIEDFSDKLPPDAIGYLKRVIDNALRLDKMILDVLTFSRIAREDPISSKVTLARLVDDVIEHYPGLKPPAAEVKNEVKHDVLGHEPALMQAVSNLLGNAVKFVPAGILPSVRVWTEPRGSEVRLWIEDNGIGIPVEYQHRLFGMFERINPTSDYEGTGVGLAITRKAVERMGGKVGVESNGRTGSKFWIQLPAANPVS